MSKDLGNVPNRLGLNYGNKASKVNKSSSTPFQRIQDKIKELERSLEKQRNQNGKIQDKVKGFEQRLEEQYDQNEKMQDEMKDLKQRLEEQSNRNEKIQDTTKELELALEEQYNQNEKMQDKIKNLERRLEGQYYQNEMIQKTRDQRFEYHNGKIEKLDESVQKLTNWTSQLKDRVDEDVQKRYQETDTLNTMQSVQHAMKQVLATVMEQQHKHISDMIEFQTQLPDMIQRELSIQKTFNTEPLLDRDPNVYAKPTHASPQDQETPYPHPQKQQQIDAPSPNLAMQLDAQPSPAVISQQLIFNLHPNKECVQIGDVFNNNCSTANNKPPLRYPKDFRNEEYWQFELRLAKNEKIEPRRPWSVDFSKQFQINNPRCWENESCYEIVIVDPAWENKKSPPPFQGDLTDGKLDKPTSTLGQSYDRRAGDNSPTSSRSSSPHRQLDRYPANRRDRSEASGVYPS
ncbi:hypothetical protein BHYA_0087g00130 [Botrytis hyacinthi]|uniref:Uncharacterized protein n=1 Tax=Botrytis hyacinthi TaxID=278943 RepID=A0A4Z1GME2_9HELO|nr:hypothetical protein BHYA_0087g00130 [Botrytis hyacinthi]